jgi:hypothetical protein
MHRRWRAFRRSLRKLTAKDWMTALALAKAVIDVVRALTGNG